MFFESSKPSTRIKDQTNHDLDEWLKHNKPTIIPRGVSTQTGYTRGAPEPKPKAKAVPLPKTVKEPKPKPTPKPKLKIKKKLKSVPKPKAVYLVHANGIFEDFSENKVKGDLARLAEYLGVGTRALRRYAQENIAPREKLAEFTRLMANFKCSTLKPKKKYVSRLDEIAIKNRDRKREAVANGETRFTGICREHGETEFLIFFDNKKRPVQRCLACKKVSNDLANKNRASDYFEIRKANRKILENMITKGESVKSFIGMCHRHGKAKMYAFKTDRTKIGYTYSCSSCRQRK